MVSGGLQAYTADKLFTGTAWLTDHAVVVNNGIIHEVCSTSILSSDLRVHHYENAILSPAFIDLQIYGAHGKLLSAYPVADAIFALHDYCVQGGAAYFLPTVATHTREVVEQCIDAIRDYWNQGGEGVLGIHLEGPWIHPMRKGAHIESYIHAPTMDEVESLLAYGQGVIKMITLAPEHCSEKVIQRICEEGIIVSAGHSDATYDESKKAFTTGIRAATHLYNAMSPLQHRAPGLVGAIMDDNHVMASIIPDGYHVDFAAIRIAKAVLKDRLFVITDAVTSTDQGPYQHILQEDKYTNTGVLSGSALTMHKAMLNLIEHCDIEMGEAIRSCSVYPARLMGLDQQLGYIQKGFQAKMVVLDMAQRSCVMV